ncbi:peptidoglycan DD-metalloendopeptidase family protein [Vibrio paucivorans]
MKNFKAIAFSTAVIALSIAYFIPDIEHQSHPIQSDDQSMQVVITPAPEQDVEPKPIRVHYIVKVGDTLSDIFSSWKLSYQTLQQVLSADLAHLQLDMIKPGEHLELVIDSENGELLSLIYHISLVEQAVYTRSEDGEFSYAFNELPSEWRDTIYSGTINGSFSLSAYNIGLSSAQIANITQVLRDKIDFSRALRAGDKFDVLVKRQYLGDHETGNSEVQAVSFKLASGEISAYLAEDGRFYDREGNSLERAFNRYPVDKQYRRITSAFNPKRKHPVTGRIAPHNGTDFATPVGAYIYSTGDGRVTAIRNHPYAGKYLVIQHNSVYTTRYLHLDSFLVKKGQEVKRGQKIAISGATGRLTGPHLHFEVLVRNRPVDPMKVDLPIARSISDEDKAAFLAKIDEFESQVEASKSRT